MADAPLHLAPTHHSPPRQRLGLTRLAMLLFFAVSGGAYGLEDVVGKSGPGMGLVLILVTPVIWPRLHPSYNTPYVAIILCGPGATD